MDLGSAGRSRSSREQAPAYYTSVRHQANRRETGEALHWDQGSSLAHAAKRASHSLTRSTEVMPGRTREQVMAHRGNWPGACRPPASVGCYPQAAAGEHGPTGKSLRQEATACHNSWAPIGFKGPCSCKCKQPRQQPCYATANHGSSARTWQWRPETKQGQPSPKGYVLVARVPYLEHLLGLVQQGCEPAQLPDACAPALARAHADLATSWPRQW